jgi:hypothetical protein
VQRAKQHAVRAESRRRTRYRGTCLQRSARSAPELESPEGSWAEAPAGASGSALRCSSESSPWGNGCSGRLKLGQLSFLSISSDAGEGLRRQLAPPDGHSLFCSTGGGQADRGRRGGRCRPSEPRPISRWTRSRGLSERSFDQSRGAEEGQDECGGQERNLFAQPPPQPRWRVNEHCSPMRRVKPEAARAPRLAPSLSQPHSSSMRASCLAGAVANPNAALPPGRIAFRWLSCNLACAQHMGVDGIRRPPYSRPLPHSRDVARGTGVWEENGPWWVETWYTGGRGLRPPS